MNNRILLLEDNPISREFLYEALLPLGAQIDTADTLAAALSQARQHAHTLFLCDVHLPDGGPQEILHALRQQQKQTILIAVTAEASKESAQGLLAMGYQEVWLKPITMATLQGNVARLMGIITLPVFNEQKTDLWDEAAALRAVGNNEATLSALRKMFLVELTQQIKMMEQAFENRNAPTLKAECHKLLASCGFVGAVSLNQAVRKLSETPTNSECMTAFKLQANQYLINH